MALWDAVDYFVIVEANRKHTGEPKDFNLLKRADDFKDFFPKIRYVAADLSQVPFKGTGDWAIENAQRNAIANGTGDAADDDLIMISDLDEIPAPDIFRRLQENQIALVAPVVLPLSLADKGITCPAQLLVPASAFLDVGAIVMEQEFFYYYFDWSSKDKWYGTTLTKRKNLTTPQAMRDQRGRLPRAVGGGLSLFLYGRYRPRDNQNAIDCRRQRTRRNVGRQIYRQETRRTGNGDGRRCLQSAGRSILLLRREEYQSAAH